MATREISTKLVLAGEREYRSQIATVNRELRTMESAIKLVDSQFKGQQNTMTALTAKNKALNDAIAKQSEKLRAEQAALEKNAGYKKEAAAAAQAVVGKMAQLNECTSDAYKETDEYNKQLEKLQKQYNAHKAAEEEAAVAVDKHTQKANEAQIKLNDLNGELKNNEKYLSEASVSADGCASSIDGMGKQVKDAAEDLAKAKKQSDTCTDAVDKMGKEAKGTAEDFGGLGSQGKKSVEALAGALAAAGITASLKEIADAIMACLNASKTFESAMAGVAKTTDMTDAQLAQMGEEIQKLSETIPLTTTELAQIAEVGGQLGIAQENLIGFTEVMANLGVATNMTSEEAATMLAQFANVTGMDPSLYINLGSAIVDLGNNFATNEKKITDMAQTMASAGANARMSEPDILALSAAVTSLGIESGTGGTNMAKLIGEMQMAVETGENLDVWAQAAGMSARDFARLWGEDATAALLAFIRGLGTTEESALQTLSVLKLNDERLVRMVTSLNNAEKTSGLLTRALQTSNKAWQENAALQKEAATRYATTESKEKLLANATNNLKVAIGDQLKPAMNDALKAGTDLTKWATEYIKQNQTIVPLITAVVTAVGTFVGVMATAAAGIKLVNAAMAALSGTMMANPWVVAITAAVSLGIAIAAYAAAANKANEDVEALNEANQKLADTMTEASENYNQTVERVEAQADVVDTLCGRLDELNEKTSLTVGEQGEYAQIVEQLNQLIPGMNAQIDTQTGKLNISTEAIKNHTTAWKDQQVALAVAEQRQVLVNTLTEAQTQLTIAENKHAENQEKITDFEYRRAKAMEELAAKMGYTQEAYEGLEYWQRQNVLQTARSRKEAREEGSELQRLIGYIDACDGSVQSLTTKNKELDGAIEKTTKTVDDATTSIEEHDRATEGLIEKYSEMPTASEEAQTAITTQKNALTMMMDAYKLMGEKQAEVRDEIISQFDSVVGAFDKIVPDMAVPIDEIRDNLESQLAYWNNYGSLVQWAIANDMNPKMLAELSDGSLKSMSILQGLQDGGVDAMKEMGEKFEKIDTMKEKIATPLANEKLKADKEYQEMVVNAQDAMNNLLNELDIGDQTYAAVSNTVQGIIDAITDKMDGVQTAVTLLNGIVGTIGFAGALFGGKSKGKPHAAGIDYVPYDGYPAILHKGERVQTAMEARAQRALDNTVYGTRNRVARMETMNNNTNNSLVVNVTVNGPGDGNQIADAVADRLRYRGVVLTP